MKWKVTDMYSFAIYTCRQPQAVNRDENFDQGQKAKVNKSTNQY